MVKIDGEKMGAGIIEIYEIMIAEIGVVIQINELDLMLYEERLIIIILKTTRQ